MSNRLHSAVVGEHELPTVGGSRLLSITLVLLFQDREKNLGIQRSCTLTDLYTEADDSSNNFNTFCFTSSKVGFYPLREPGMYP